MGERAAGYVKRETQKERKQESKKESNEVLVAVDRYFTALAHPAMLGMLNLVPFRVPTLIYFLFFALCVYHPLPTGRIGKEIEKVAAEAVAIHQAGISVPYLAVLLYRFRSPRLVTWRSLLFTCLIGSDVPLPQMHITVPVPVAARS